MPRAFPRGLRDPLATRDQPRPAIVAVIDSMRYRRMLRLILGPLGVSLILYYYYKIKTFSGMRGTNRRKCVPGPLRH